MSNQSDSPKPAPTQLGTADIERLATMSRLRLTPEETVIMTEKLNAIFGYLNVLQTAKVDGVEPMSHVQEIVNVTREDKSAPSMPVEELLKIAPDASGRFIRTPLVIDG